MSTASLIEDDLSNVFGYKVLDFVHFHSVFKDIVIWLCSIVTTQIDGSLNTYSASFLVDNNTRTITVTHTQGKVLLSVNYDDALGYNYYCVNMCIIIEAHLHNMRDPFSIGLKDAAEFMMASNNVPRNQMTEIQLYLQQQYTNQRQGEKDTQTRRTKFAERVIRFGYRGMWVVAR